MRRRRERRVDDRLRERTRRGLDPRLRHLHRDAEVRDRVLLQRQAAGGGDGGRADQGGDANEYTGEAEHVALVGALDDREPAEAREHDRRLLAAATENERARDRDGRHRAAAASTGHFVRTSRRRSVASPSSVRRFETARASARARARSRSTTTSGVRGGAISGSTPLASASPRGSRSPARGGVAFWKRPFATSTRIAAISSSAPITISSAAHHGSAVAMPAAAAAKPKPSANTPSTAAPSREAGADAELAWPCA